MRDLLLAVGIGLAALLVGGPLTAAVAVAVSTSASRALAA
jgi:hypothetical protein